MKCTLRCLRMALLLSLLLLSVHAATAKVGVCGHIRIWNPLTDQYEPLAKARVRVVLAEYRDSDTWDKEDTTDRDGYYEIIKGEPWFRDAYDAYIIVFAESPYKLEIQEYYSQIDGYQAESRKVSAPDGKYTTIDLTLGGVEDDVDEWQLGGVADLDNSDPTYSRTGWQAFFIFHEMTDHRLFLVDRALGEGNFEEKEVSFPHSEDPVRERVLDYIKIPDRVFPQHYTTQDALNTLMRASHTFRHELSHGVMADEYWIMPDSAGEHSYWDPCVHHQGAWVEGWADFLAHASLVPRYQNRLMLDPTASVPYIDCEPSPEVEMPGGQLVIINDLIEGYIANALWDIHDGTGWERRRIQRTDVPGDELFWDGISDPDLDGIWDVFADEHPNAFSHDHSAFVRFWLEREELGSKHELKSILFNQGISDLRLREGAPIIEIGEIGWDKWTARIPVTITEFDVEDRPHVRANVFLNDRSVQRVTLGEDGWQDRQKTITIDQDVAWAPGLPNPRFLIEADDNMMSDVMGAAPEPPPQAQMGGVIAELLEVNVSREADPPLASNYWFTGMPELRDIFCNVTATDGTSTAPRPTQLSGTDWRTRGDSYAWAETREIYKQARLPDYVELSFKVGGRQQLGLQGTAHTTLTAEVPIRWLRDDAYGFAPERRETVLDETLEVTNAGGQTVSLRTRFEVVYRLRPFMPAQPRTPPQRGMISELPRGPGQPTRGRPGAGADLTTTPPLAGMEVLSLSAALSRSSTLTEEYVRIQGEALAIAEELEAKLDPGRRPQPDRPADTGGAQRTLAVPSLMTTQDLLRAPQQTTFLANASTGQLTMPVLTAQQMVYLQELRQEVAAREARLPEIEAQRTQLIGLLDSGLHRLGGVSDLRTAERTAIQDHVDEVKARLVALAPTMGDYTTILARERETIDVALSSADQPAPTAPIRSPRIPPPPPAQPAQPAQPTQVEGWLLSGGASISRDDTGMVISFAGPGLAVRMHSEHHSLRLSLEYRHVGATGEIGFCVDGEGADRTAYLVRVKADGIAVCRVEAGRETVLGSTATGVPPGDWHEMKIDLKRGRFTIGVDGQQLLDARDDEAYLRGGQLTFGCLAGESLACREIRTVRW